MVQFVQKRERGDGGVEKSYILRDVIFEQSHIY